MCWHCVKYVLTAWGQLKRGFEVLALGEICFEGMGQLKRGCEVLAPGEMCFQGIRLKRGLRYWHSVKYVLRA